MPHCGSSVTRATAANRACLVVLRVSMTLAVEGDMLRTSWRQRGTGSA